MKDGDRVIVSDFQSPFFGHGGWAFSEGDLWNVFLDSRPTGSPPVYQFPPLFRREQLIRVKV